jgi:hypothetical protein
MFAEVYRGYNLKTFEEVAIKMLNLTKLVKQNGRRIVSYIG